MHIKRETTSDFFYRIMTEISKDEQFKDILDKLDYFLAWNAVDVITNDEFDVVAIPIIGSNEGWYTDVYIDGDWGVNKEKRKYIGTCKTLYEGLEGGMMMGKLAGILLYMGRKVLLENEEIYASDTWLEKRKRA